MFLKITKFSATMLLAIIVISGMQMITTASGNDCSKLQNPEAYKSILTVGAVGEALFVLLKDYTAFTPPLAEQVERNITLAPDAVPISKSLGLDTTIMPVDSTEQLEAYTISRAKRSAFLVLCARPGSVPGTNSAVWNFQKGENFSDNSCNEEIFDDKKKHRYITDDKPESVFSIFSSDDNKFDLIYQSFKHKTEDPVYAFCLNKSEISMRDFDGNGTKLLDSCDGEPKNFTGPSFGGFIFRRTVHVFKEKGVFMFDRAVLDTKSVIAKLTSKTYNEFFQCDSKMENISLGSSSITLIIVVFLVLLVVSCGALYVFTMKNSSRDSKESSTSSKKSPKPSGSGSRKNVKSSSKKSQRDRKGSK